MHEAVRWQRSDDPRRSTPRLLLGAPPHCASRSSKSFGARGPVEARLPPNGYPDSFHLRPAYHPALACREAHARHSQPPGFECHGKVPSEPPGALLRRRSARPEAPWVLLYNTSKQLRQPGLDERVIELYRPPPFNSATAVRSSASLHRLSWKSAPSGVNTTTECIGMCRRIVSRPSGTPAVE